MSSGIESSIGKLPITGKPAQTFVVDDPTAPQQRPAASLEPQRMTPEEFNAYRQRLASMQNQQMNIGPGAPIHIQGQQIDIPPGAVPIDEAEVMRMVGQAREQRKIVTPAAKNKLELLLGLGRKKIAIDIEGHQITLKNLSSHETKLVMNAISEVTGFERVYVAKHMTLAYAIDAVDGEPIGKILGDDDTIALRSDLIENMEASVVDKLYSSYTSSLLVVIKDDQEAKEVSEDLKKS
jgi:hypothetical protein